MANIKVSDLELLKMLSGRCSDLLILTGCEGMVNSNLVTSHGVLDSFVRGKINRMRRA